MTSRTSALEKAFTIPGGAIHAPSASAAHALVLCPTNGGEFMSTRIRILTVDDHPLLRAGIDALVSSQPDMLVVAECSNGRDAIQQVPQASSGRDPDGPADAGTERHRRDHRDPRRVSRRSDHRADDV